jgi:hypothetical protein
VPMQSIARSLPPASPQDSFSAIAGVGQSPDPNRTSGAPFLPRCEAGFAVLTRDNRDHENHRCYFRVGVDYDCRRDLFGRRVHQRTSSVGRGTGPCDGSDCSCCSQFGHFATQGRLAPTPSKSVKSVGAFKHGFEK